MKLTMNNFFHFFFFDFEEKNRATADELTAVICSAYFKAILMNN